MQEVWLALASLAKPPVSEPHPGTKFNLKFDYKKLNLISIQAGTSRFPPASKLTRIQRGFNDLTADRKTRLDRLPGEGTFIAPDVAETRERKMTGKNESPGLGNIS